MASADVLHRALLVLIFSGIIFSLLGMAEVLSPALAGACSPSSIPWLSCADILHSGRTTVLGVPDWSIGLGGFSLLFALEVLLLRTYAARYLKLLLAFSALGLLFAAYFVSVETSLGRLCLICTGAHLSGLGVFVVAFKLWQLRTARSAEEKPTEEGDQPTEGGGKSRTRRTPERARRDRAEEDA